MEKQEARLKAALVKELRRQLPSFVVLQLATPGAPDRAVVGNGKTTYWEFKHGTPHFASPGNQELLCMRLNQEGFCRYVIWQEDRDGKNRRTLIALPQHIMPQTELSCEGFNHIWLVNQIRRVHFSS